MNILMAVVKTINDILFVKKVRVDSVNFLNIQLQSHFTFSNRLGIALKILVMAVVVQDLSGYWVIVAGINPNGTAFQETFCFFQCELFCIFGSYHSGIVLASKLEIFFNIFKRRGMRDVWKPWSYFCLLQFIAFSHFHCERRLLFRVNRRIQWIIMRELFFA